MVRDTLGLKHHYERHRAASKLRRDVRNTRQIRTADTIIYIGGILGLIFTIPQVATIWMEKNAGGLSLISWTSYFVVALFWIYYGIVHREKPIIITNIIWLFFDAIIIVGIFLYG